MRWKHCWLVPLLLLLALGASAQTFKGRVVGVSDGDTIRVLVEGLKGKREVKVRLHGVDAPESHQAYGSKAKQFTSSFCFGKEVLGDVRDTDRYGRLVAEVLVSGKSLNAALVENGLAWAYRRYSQEFVEHEKRAREAKKGLWADPKPVPPWDFRRGEDSGSGGGGTSSTPPAAAKPASSLRSTPPPKIQVREITVYITRTGAKYHRDGCRYLSRSQIATSLSEAQKYYSPCSVCRP